MLYKKKITKLNNVKNQIKPNSSNTKIELPSVNKVTRDCNIPIFIKIQNLISDNVYKRIFSDNQLKEVLKSVYDHEKVRNLQAYQKKLSDLRLLQKNHFPKAHGNYFAKRVRKSILQDTQRSSRYIESKNPLSLQSDFNITPIKLYQHNLLSKYCILKNYICLPEIKLDCIDFLEKVDYNKYVSTSTHSDINPIQSVECSKYNLPSLSSFAAVNFSKMKKISTATDEAGKKIKSNKRKHNSEKVLLESVSNYINQQTEKIKNENKETDPMQLKQLNNEEIIQESEPIFTKSNYRGYVQPRLSKENIQELIRQSVTNVLNKDKEYNQCEIRKQRKPTQVNQRRRSTISESPFFTESGDFELTLDTSRNQSSLDIAFNESYRTTLALNQTKECIKFTEQTEEITWSGNRIGKYIIGTDLTSNSRYDGNYGRVDGINLMNQFYPNFGYSNREKMATETFTALSHMYSLKKLLERRSVQISPDQQAAISSQSFSFSKAILGTDKESFQSEDSTDSSFTESRLSCDVKLINIFKNKLCK